MRITLKGKDGGFSYAVSQCEGEFDPVLPVKAFQIRDERGSFQEDCVSQEDFEIKFRRIFRSPQISSVDEEKAKTSHSVKWL